MSDLDEKLQRQHTHAGKARATLGHLLQRRAVLDRGLGCAAPAAIDITSMGRVEHWVRVSGTGKDSVYELR